MKHLSAFIALAVAAVLLAAGGVGAAEESDEMIRLRAENTLLRATIRRLSAEVDTLKKEIERLQSNRPQKAPEAAPKQPQAAAATGVDFFGLTAQAGKVVYLVDRSGSMTDTMDMLKLELKRSISGLPPEVQFHIIFYSSGPPVEMPGRKLMPATPANRNRAWEFIRSTMPQGETDPAQALERAFACGPDVIFFLSDGEFDRGTVALVKRLNADGKVRVHTIGYLYRTGEPVLKEIAQQNGGMYRFVSEMEIPKLLEWERRQAK